MDIASSKRLTSRRARRKRVGCGQGSGHGKSSGKGQRGARARSGWTSRLRTGGQMPLFRRLPKRGFNNAQYEKQYTIINVDDLLGFPAQTVVTPELLHKSDVAKKIEKSGVKLLGRGLIDKPLTVRVNAVSKEARVKIEAAGGAIELIPPPKKPVKNKMRRPAAS